jgi:hypothetical protein
VNDGQCWVLLRLDMTWHLLANGCRDVLGLYGRPTACDRTTPTDPLGVVAFTEAPPHDHGRVCTWCEKSVYPGRRNSLLSIEARIDRLLEQVEQAYSDLEQVSGDEVERSTAR